MGTKAINLTKVEREVIILTAAHLSNVEIAQNLDISISKVKILLHQAYNKLGAHNRIDAINISLTKGEIKLNELYTIDVLLEFLNSLLYPYELRRIAKLVRKRLEYENLQAKDERITIKDRKQDTELTKYEKDVLVLVCRGFTNREIADTLFLSIHTVGTFLHRIYNKLGARKRTDAVKLALIRGEISINDIWSLNELLRFFTPLGAESIDELSQLLDTKLFKSFY